MNEDVRTCFNASVSIDGSGNDLRCFNDTNGGAVLDVFRAVLLVKGDDNPPPPRGVTLPEPPKPPHPFAMEESFVVVEEEDGVSD